MWLLPRHLVLFCIAASLHQPYSGLAQGLFSTTIRCKWMFNPIRHRAIGLMKGICITLSSSLFFKSTFLIKVSTSLSFAHISNCEPIQIVSYDHLPSLIHIRALCFHVLSARPKALLYQWNILYIPMSSCIENSCSVFFGVRVPTLRSCRVTFSKRTIVDKHLSTLNSKLTYGKVRH